MCTHTADLELLIFLYFQEGTLVVGGPGSFYWQGKPKISAPVLGFSVFIGWMLLRLETEMSLTVITIHANTTSSGTPLQNLEFCHRTFPCGEEK